MRRSECVYYHHDYCFYCDPKFRKQPQSHSERWVVGAGFKLSQTLLIAGWGVGPPAEHRCTSVPWCWRGPRCHRAPRLHGSFLQGELQPGPQRPPRCLFKGTEAELCLSLFDTDLWSWGKHFFFKYLSMWAWPWLQSPEKWGLSNPS